MSTKTRKFLVPVAAALASLLATNSEASTIPDSPVQPSPDNANAIEGTKSESTSSTPIGRYLFSVGPDIHSLTMTTSSSGTVLAQHDSHSSHDSHASHASHDSHSSHSSHSSSAY